MQTFKAGEVVVEWRADLKKFKASAQSIEKISKSAGVKASAAFSSGYKSKLDARNVGLKFSADFAEAVDANKTGEKLDRNYFL
jgi:hypothetical protein